MKKFLIVLALMCTASTCALCACGSDNAEVSGIQMQLAKDGAYIYGSLDSTGVVLPVGEEYTLSVKYVQSGGSKIAMLPVEDVNLQYDTAALQITSASESEYDPVYTIVALSPVSYTQVTASAGGYSSTMYISFE